MREGAIPPAFSWSVASPVPKCEGSFGFAHDRLGGVIICGRGRRGNRSHLPMTNIFPASGQDDFLWIDVFSQNQFRRICLID
jgi:hypothetical protein